MMIDNLYINVLIYETLIVSENILALAVANLAGGLIVLAQNVINDSLSP